MQVHISLISSLFIFHTHERTHIQKKSLFETDGKLSLPSGKLFGSGQHCMTMAKTVFLPDSNLWGHVC